MFRKKKNNKAKEVLETLDKVEEKKTKQKDTRTPAQKAFDGIQKKRVCLSINCMILWPRPYCHGYTI